MKLKRFHYLVITIVLFFVFRGFFNKPKERFKGMINPLTEVPVAEVYGVSVTLEATESVTLSPTIAEVLVSVEATPTPTKVKPSPTATPTPTPTMASSQEVNGYIDRFAAQYGVDPNVIRHMALCESGFRSNAKNGSYIGLFQFGPITWKNLRKEIGEDGDPYLRYSAEESVQTAAYAFSVGKSKIWPNCVP